MHSREVDNLHSVLIAFQLFHTKHSKLNTAYKNMKSVLSHRLYGKLAKAIGSTDQAEPIKFTDVWWSEPR